MHVWSKHNHWIQGMTLIITHFSLESKFGSSHLISLPFMPSDTQGSNKGPPQLSVPNQLLDAVPAVPKILISVLTVHYHVFLGLPCLCLPSVKCCIRTESLSLSWWPTYLHHLCRMMVPKMHSSLHCISRSLLQIVWGQRICKIFSQTFGVVRSVSVICQHSDSYKRAIVDLELDACSVCDDHQTLFSIEGVPGFF